MKWLIVAPHGDDMEYGMGGMVQKYREVYEDLHITLVVMGASEYRAAHSGKMVTRQKRLSEIRAAANLLKIDDVKVGNFVENEYDATPQKYLIQTIETLMLKIEPDQMFIPLPSFNQDHRAVHDACITVMRPKYERPMPDYLYAYEYPGNCFDEDHSLGRLYVPLSNAQFFCKMHSLELHESQTKGARGILSMDGAEVLARQRGAECGFQHAEMLYLIRGVG